MFICLSINGLPSRCFASSFVSKLCSPNRTEDRVLFKQWAAVKICRFVINEPPHLNDVSPKSFEYPIKAIHGNAPNLAGVPPTILLWVTLLNPHPVSGVSSLNCSAVTMLTSEIVAGEQN